VTFFDIVIAYENTRNTAYLFRDYHFNILGRFQSCKYIEVIN
jgi:hypothetical protein